MPTIYIAYFICLLVVQSFISPLFADEVSDFDKFAWSENIGWLNFKSSHEQVTVYNDHLEGYIWAENIGWIRVGTHTEGGHFTYSNDAAGTYGVNNDGFGNLSGYGWGENIGWVNFNSANSQVTIDSNSGDFNGYAWSENIGWIHFQNISPDYKVKRVLNLITDIPPAIDLSQNGVLTDLQNTASIVGNSNEVNLSQDSSTGNLNASSGQTIFVLRPVRFEETLADFVPGTMISEDGLIIFVSDQGKKLTLLPEPQQLEKLDNNLTGLGLKSLQQDYGMLKISFIADTDATNSWFATRTGFSSSPAESTAEEGLSAIPISDPVNTIRYEHLFKINGVLYRQNLYPTPADWSRLKAYLKSFGTTNIDPEGYITVQIANNTYRAIVDYAVEPSDLRYGQITISDIGDKNGDGIGDYQVIYPNGDKQILYLLQNN